MNILIFIRDNWKALFIAFIVVISIYFGWHLRSMQYAMSQSKEQIRNAELGNDFSEKLERNIQDLNEQTQILNQKLKVTYGQTGNDHPIPSSGLHILQQADE